MGKIFLKEVLHSMICRMLTMILIIFFIVAGCGIPTHKGKQHVKQQPETIDHATMSSPFLTTASQFGVVKVRIGSGFNNHHPISLPLLNLERSILMPSFLKAPHHVVLWL